VRAAFQKTLLVLFSCLSESNLCLSVWFLSIYLILRFTRGMFLPPYVISTAELSVVILFKVVCHMHR